MKRHSTIALQILLWIFSLCWLVFLVWMSSQDGLDTLSTSMGLADFVIRFFGISTDHLSYVNQLLRISAHFAGFFILGSVVYISTKVSWPNHRRSTVAVVVLCSVIAVLDEVKKIFINGRHLSWLEAGLNVLGVICGVAISLGILWFIARRKMHDARLQVTNESCCNNHLDQ